MAIPVQRRRDTAANWTSVNPILIDGQQGFETDTLQWKLGDGVTAWNSLSYASGGGGSGDMVLASVQTVTGKKTFGSAGAVGKLAVAGTTSGSTIIDATAIAGSGTVTLPTTGTLATLAGSETLSNKTLVAPALGTPASGTLTNCTGLPVSTGVSGLAANVATFLATPSSANLAAALTDETGTGANVFANSPTLVTPALGTPSSATLTNATGLPVSTGITGLGTGVATFLATPSSANLAAALTDETGTGANVFANSPTLVTPALGTPSAVVLTNATGLPLTTGVTGILPHGNLGTGGGGSTKFLREDSTYQTISGGGDALVANPLSQFAATTSAQLAGVISDETGTGALVFANTPTLVTPVLGVASATTVNKVALTAPATGSTLTIADGKTLTSSNTLTFAGTDGSTLNVGAGGTLGSLALLSAAPAGTLTGATLASGVTASSLTSVGTITTGVWNGTALDVFYGGTGAGTFTDGGVLIGNSTGAIQATSAGTAGQVLISGGTGVDPAFGAIPSHNHAASDITSGTVATARLGSGTANSTTYLRGDQTWATVSGTGDALTSNPLSQFAATTSAQLAGVISDETGNGALVFANTPTLVTPTIGVATATSINKVSVTAPATSATITIADGKTLTASNTLTFTGTDSSSVAFGAGGTVLYNGGALGTPSSGTLTNATGLPVSTGISGLGSGVATFLATPSSANLAAAVTGETGTGALVFDTAPTLSSTVTIGTAGGTTGAALFKGTTSGTVTLTTAAAAGTHTIKLPTADGTTGQLLKTDGSGQWGWVAPGAGSGDVVGPSSATDGAPVLFDGTTGKLIKNSTPTGTNQVVLSTAPTISSPSLITPSTDSIAINGSSSGTVTLTVAAAAGTHSIKLPTTGGTNGEYMKTDGATQLSWVSPWNDGVAEGTIASATTTELSTVASDKVSITGTTTITGFGSPAAGMKREGRFTGALTLTHNATSLILPGGANITTAAGDRFQAYSLGGGNWVVSSYTKADGTAVVGGGSGTKTIAIFVPADNEPPSSNYATLLYRNNHPSLAFDTTTQETAIFRGRIPEGSVMTSGVTVYLQWAATSATTGTIGWDVAFERLVDAGQDLDSDNFGTAQTVTAATVSGTSGITLVTSVNFSQAQLPTSLDDGNMYRIRIRRDVANDTATGDAELYQVEVRLQ